MQNGKVSSRAICSLRPFEVELMNSSFTYMGTKHRISDQVADIICRSPDGPILDLFAGVSAVGKALIEERPVWCNDIQHFAFNVAGAFFTSKSGARLSIEQIAECEDYFNQNLVNLSNRFRALLAKEEQALANEDVAALAESSTELILMCEAEAAGVWRQRLRSTPQNFPYCLFTITHSGGYVGLRQAIEIDSIRYSTDHLLQRERISTESWRWMIIALCHALFAVSNSTGHFAQYLTVKPSNKYRFFVKRRRSPWNAWLGSLNSMIPFGRLQWRLTNKAFRKEAILLLKDLQTVGNRPVVVYADPPYTRDQYSRYYHFLETIILYDYPKISGKGQYRPDRYSSPFCNRTEVCGAFTALVENAARVGTTLVLSYPENGFLPDSVKFLLSLLRTSYRKVEIAGEISHQHSTMGASKGLQKSSVTEMIYLATN
jgi:adenine-specific DNA-methyltransferase